jgi:hypothetical protein
MQLENKSHPTSCPISPQRGYLGFLIADSQFILYFPSAALRNRCKNGEAKTKDCKISLSLLST